MGASGNVHRKVEVYKDSQNKSDSLKYMVNDHDMIIKTDLKKILFLLIQQKEFNKSINIYEPKSFNVIKDNLKNYEQNYSLDNIIDYLNSFIKNQSLKEKIDWNKAVDTLQNYYPNLEKDKKKIKSGIEYYKTKNIKYPHNFSLIESQFFSSFNSISNSNEQLNPDITKMGYIIFIN